MTPLHADRLYALLGQEHPVDEVARTLRTYVQSFRPPVVGAMRVGCSDEAEQEAIDAFQRQFVRYLLPSLTFSSRSPFRSANLGGRYEWGAIRIAEDHYALAQGAEGPDGWKIQVLKLNAHVSVVDTPSGPVFGRAPRYGSDSTYCGALHAVLDGAPEPFAQVLTQDFAFEGVDRLPDVREVAPDLRSLFVAVTHARVQARRAMLDVQDYTPRSPTLYLIVPCVTLNRSAHDTEIVCGLYTADRRGGEPHDEYCGLSDHPLEYRLKRHASGLLVEDPHLHEPRIARDHRKLVLDSWKAQGEPGVRMDSGLTHSVKQARDAAKERPVATAALKTLVLAAMATAPVPAALLLFGEGVVRIHHANRAHRLAREAHDDDAAREMLADLSGRIDALEPERAQHLVHLLAEVYGRK